MSDPLVLISGDRKLPEGYGYLHVPKQRVYRFDRRWACDNGAFSGLDVVAFVTMLDRCPPTDKCVFLAVPDVVADWASTLQSWARWHPRLSGYPLAIVLQDGATVESVPWGACAAVFIGGSTRFKLSGTARTIAAYALARGKWVHMGRVNGRTRFRYAASIGVQSIDGSGFSRFSNERMAECDAWRREGLPTSAPPMQGELEL
jgi:hypothetical protein